MTSQGTKRKCESFDTLMEFPPTTDMEIMELTKQLMEKVTSNEMYKPGTKKTTIGIFGKSGEGKSSLINAILGKQYLVPSGCFGACTAVVTQVEANLDDSNYTAEIELFSKKEWEKELTGLFRDIEDGSEERNEELMEIAVEKMTALYGPDAHKKTLKELKRGAKFAEIERFLLENRKRISKNDVDGFACEVARYIQRSEASLGGWFWPLVKSVIIKIPDCRELLENIVLVDLPGTGDCNKMRNDLWKSKLRECSSVWIVSDIKRAITDKDPWGILKHCIEELGPGGKCKSFKFICTKTDDINPVEYIRSGLFPTDQISGDKNEKNACIPHRNGHAKMKVGEKFENSEIKKIFSTDDQFQVFTVSSNAFFDHSLNMKTSETEIPKLQHELRILNKSIRRDLARDYVNEAKGFLLLIQSGHLDTDKKMIEMKGKVRKEFEKNLKKSLNDLEKYFDSINNNLKKCLSKGVDKSVQQCVASIEAVIAPKNRRMHHQTLSALCRNYGCYRSKNWDVNLDLNKRLAKHLHQCTEEFFSAIFPVTRKNRRSLQEKIEMFSIVQIDSVSSRSPILNHIHDFIRIEETKLKALLNGEIIDMKKDIYSSIQTTIERQMSSYYEEAAAVRGTGSLKKKQDLLINTVNNIKHEMFNKAKAEALKRLNKLELYVKDTTKNRLNRAIKRSQSQTCKNTMDVSEEIKQLERYLEQLAD